MTIRVEEQHSHADRLSETNNSLRDALAARYDVVERRVHVGIDVFDLLTVRDTNVLLESIDSVRFNEDERLPYWAELWASSVELARWCLQDGSLAGKRVLELGCGLGLAGVAAARAGASVMFTDYETDALYFAQYNALRNVSPVMRKIEFRLMDWRSPGDIPAFDVLLGSDVAYEKRNFLPLLCLLRQVKPSIAVFTDPDRAVGHEFFARATAEGFHVETCATTVNLNERNVTVNRHILR